MLMLMLTRFASLHSLRLQGYYPPQQPQQAYGGGQQGYYPQPQAQPVSSAM